MTRESMLGDRNPMWRGDDVGSTSLHEWVRNRLPLPDKCVACRQVPPYDLSN